MNAFLPLLRAGTTRKAFVISSTGGERESTRAMKNAGMVSYSTTRAATNMIVAKYGALLAPEGFLVAAFCPGLVDTSGTKAIPPKSACCS